MKKGQNSGSCKKNTTNEKKLELNMKKCDEFQQQVTGIQTEVITLRAQYKDSNAYDSNAWASLRDAIDCVSEVLASNGVESAEERQILVADTLNWLHTNEYIMMSRESGVCCREKYVDSIE